ncbi:hypothetical protein ARMGADRAFT_1078992 [Armillaria gallica]|uniref:Uncharacterized protein n=1 Tax=Armillaria gallica TaxID=47427 RepID=A0A2H3DJP4_ARMGA|nr:hypothetical protein ARMGADRAFT_1078992 [Armillaria gallica]
MEGTISLLSLYPEAKDISFALWPRVHVSWIPAAQTVVSNMTSLIIYITHDTQDIRFHMDHIIFSCLTLLTLACVRQAEAMHQAAGTFHFRYIRGILNQIVPTLRVLWLDTIPIMLADHIAILDIVPNIRSLTIRDPHTNPHTHDAAPDIGASSQWLQHLANPAVLSLLQPLTFIQRHAIIEKDLKNLISSCSPGCVIHHFLDDATCFLK